MFLTLNGNQNAVAKGKIDIRIVEGLSRDGIPIPAEDFDPVRLTDPEEFRRLLGVQDLARRLLPCIDTRAAHWRYYLFGAPAEHGRFLATGLRLISVLNQTDSRAGIGRRDYQHFREDGRRSKRRFVQSLQSRYDNAYRTVIGVFWGTDEQLPPLYPGPPSDALASAARSYVSTEDYADFFSNEPTRLRYMFHSRLVNFRPGLAAYIRQKGYDLERAAAGAVNSPKLDDDDRLLFFAWAVLQAYYGVADDGSAPEADDEEEANVSNGDTGDSQYYRTLARAAVELMDRLGDRVGLNPKQANTIRHRLWTAQQQKGEYQPPVLIWKLKNDGTRRRIFASVRLYAYRRLLYATGGPG